MMTSDLDLSSKERLINLVNKDNEKNQHGIVLTETNIEFGEPTTLMGGSKNTEVVVNSIPNTLTVGSVTIRYNRLDLGGLKEMVDVPIILNESDTTASALLAQIQSIYGYNITEEDLEAIIIGDVSFDGNIVTLRAKSGNLSWINEVEFLVKLDQELLSTVFVNTNLDGLRWMEELRNEPLVGVISKLGRTTFDSYWNNLIVYNGFIYSIGSGASSASNSLVKLYDLENETFLGASNNRESIRSIGFGPNGGGSLDGAEFYFCVGTQLRKVNLATKVDTLIKDLGVNYGTMESASRTKAKVFKNGNTIYITCEDSELIGKYSVVTNTHVSLPPILSANGRLFGVSFFVYGNELYGYGGYNNQVANKKLYKYNEEENIWEVFTEGLTHLSNAPALLMDDRVYFVFGNTTGESTANSKVVYYDFIDAVWGEMPNFSAEFPTGVNLHGAVAVGGAIYTYGGLNRTGYPVNDFNKIV